MTISVAIRIEGQAAGLPYEAATSESVTATLDSVAGVNSVQWTVAGGDDLVSAASYTLTPSGVKGETVTFSTSATAGTALILQAVVNADPTLYARAKVWIPANNGLEVGADGEGYEGDATHGTARIQNEAIRASGVGTDVPQTRLITTTAPLRIDGGASADLSADRTLAVTAATAVATGTVTLGGDLAGTGSTAAAPRTSGINSTTVGAGGALTTGTVLRATGVSAAAWGALDLANALAVTGVLSIGNQADQTMAGDVSGSTGANTVDAIRETSIGTAGGALATGAVLRVTGASTCDWGAVNLADTDAVTGTLPAGNQAPQALAGDLSGTTAAAVVERINGAIVPTGGALTAGNVLRVTDVDELTYSALNLAGGATWVTGVLPVANVDATATPTASKIAMWNASVYMGATRFYGSGTVATAGLLAAASNVVVASARNAANSLNVALITTDGADKVTVGDLANASAIDVSANGPVRLLSAAAVAVHATDEGLSIGMAPSLGGGRYTLGLVARSTAPTTAPSGGVVISNAAGSVEVWTPGLCKTTLNPEINAAPTSVSLPRYIHKTHTSNDTITAELVTITLPTSSSFSMTVKVSAQITTTDTRAHYKRLIRGGRGGAGAATIDDAATIGVDFDAIGLAAVPTIASDGASAITIKFTGKALTEVDVWIMVDDCVIFSA